MKENNHLAIVSKVLKKMKLTPNNTLTELANAYPFLKGYHSDILQRIKNSPLPDREVIAEYYEHLLSYINHKVTRSLEEVIHSHANIDEDKITQYQFNSLLYGIAKAGTYSTIKDLYDGFYSEYIGKIKFYYEDGQSDSTLTFLAKVYSRVLICIQLKQFLDKENKSLSFMASNKNKEDNSNGDKYKIKWNGEPEDLANLLIVLANKGWINDFQVDLTGTKTATTISKFFHITSRATGKEITPDTLKQYLKPSIAGEKDRNDLMKNFGSINPYVPKTTKK